MCAKLSSYLTKKNEEGGDDFIITYRREGSFSIDNYHTISVGSAQAMSIDEYYQCRRNRKYVTKKESRRKQDLERRKQSISKKTSKKGPSNISDAPTSQLADKKENSSTSSIAERCQETLARIIKTSNTASSSLTSSKVDDGGGGRGRGRTTIGSILDDIRLVIEDAEKDCDEVEELKVRWQDDISRLLQKWEQEKKRLLRKQSQFVLPKRSKQQPALV
jgi:hypothetical protein